MIKKHEIMRQSLGWLCVLLLCHSCQDPWDEHARDFEGLINEPLLVRLEAEPELGTFMAFLHASGVDSLQDGPNAYHVLGPESAKIAKPTDRESAAQYE